MFFDFLREKKTDTHSHKWITDMILNDLKYINSLYDLTNKRLSRIEEKLFTEKENVDFLFETALSRFDKKE